MQLMVTVYCHIKHVFNTSGNTCNNTGPKEQKQSDNKSTVLMQGIEPLGVTYWYHCCLFSPIQDKNGCKYLLFGSFKPCINPSNGLGNLQRTDSWINRGTDTDTETNWQMDDQADRQIGLTDWLTSRLTDGLTDKLTLKTIRWADKWTQAYWQTLRQMDR